MSVRRVLAGGRAAFPKRGDRPSNMRQPSYEGKRSQYAEHMVSIEESLYENIPAVRSGGRARRGHTVPRTDRRGVTRVYRGDLPTRLAAADVAAVGRAQAQKAKSAAIKKRVKDLARKRELEAKAAANKSKAEVDRVDALFGIGPKGKVR